jgi:hypothetical protein
LGATALSKGSRFDEKMGGGMAPQLVVTTQSRHCFRVTTLRWGTEIPDFEDIPMEIRFTNIADMILQLYTTSAPSALSALFGRFWLVLPKKGHKAKSPKYLGM